jgi:hypothetical protein
MRWPSDEPRADVAPADPPLVAALARPENPIAAIAEKTAASVRDAATATRVTLDTERMPRSRERVIRRGVGEPGELDRI